ncbi:MAG: hypothetical protein R6W31_07040 [Bacteroidales bacterium]
MKQLIFGFSILLAGMLLVTSCMQDNFDLDLLSDEKEIEPGLVVPLIFGSFNMDDLAEVMDTVDYSLEDENGVPYYLVYPDTIYWVDESVDFISGLNQDVVTYLQLKVNSVNELAIRMALQVYLEDENHVVLDSLFDDRGIVLDPAQIDSNGKLVNVTVDESSSTFDAYKISILGDIAYLRIKAGMHAAKGEADFVKIYSSYSINYEMSLTAETRMNTGDLN